MCDNNKFNNFGLHVWRADDAPGQPVCVATSDDYDISLSLFMENECIIGVRIDNLATGDFRDYGKIPVDAQIEALELEISDLKRQLNL